MGEINFYTELEALLAAGSVEDVWKILLENVQKAGFANMLYGVTRFHTASGFGVNDDHVILTNFGSDYTKGYFLEGRYKNGPIVQWALENEGAVSWRYVSENFDSLTDAEKEVVAFNQKHGVTAGYTIGYQHSLKRTKAAIGMSMEPFTGTQDEADEIWRIHGRDLQNLCYVAHLKVLALPVPKQILTKRQREVLEWVADGKTVFDTAQIMGLNRATVEKHLRLARDALGVDTTPQAVLKASFHNQIYTF